MKTKYCIIFLALAFLLYSCSQEQDMIQDGRMRTLKTVEAEVAEIPETKAHLENGSKILWDLSDKIGVFSETGDAVPFAKTNEGNKFSSDTPVSGHEFYAFYPYSETVFNLEIRKQLSFNIGNTTIASGPNPVLVVPMVAKAEGTSFSFTQTCGILHFSITGTESLHSLTLSGNKNEKIAGTFTVNLEETTPVLSGEGSETTQVFTPDSPVALSSEKTYDVYFILPPMTFDEGFSISINYGTGTIVKKTEKSVTFSRAIIRNYDVVNLDQLIEEENSWMEDAVPPDDEIWYTTKTNTKLNLEDSYPLYNPKPFDSNIISHTYENGKGIIKCDGPITIINDHVFGNGLGENINHIAIPNTIRILHTGALRGIGVAELRIPDNLQAVGSYALNSKSIKHFTGNHTSADGKCVIIENGFMPDYNNTLTPIHNYMAAFAPSGVSEYTLPSSVEILGWYVFAWCSDLKKISFNEGLKEIMGDCFVDVNLDCEIVLPSTLESIDPYAFRACTGIKGIYGNEKFHTSDHLCLTVEQTAFWDEPEKNGTWINRFVGTELEHYDVPEGIKGIENYCFDNLPKLRTVSFPLSLKEFGAYAFYHCDNLEALYGDCASDDHKAIVFGKKFRKLVITKGVSSYTVPAGITSIGYCAFAESPELEEVIIPDSVTNLGGYDFAWCPNLKKIVLSKNLKICDRYNPFLGSQNLEEVYFRSFIPPTYADRQFNASDCEYLTIYVPEETLHIYKNLQWSQWPQYMPYMVGFKYDDIGDPVYCSSNFSFDANVTTCQSAISGDGIDVLFMGDAFSDRQIADGTYSRVIMRAIDAFFSEEPYKSMKDNFNVQYIDVISLTEGYEYGGQALGTGHGGGTYVYGNDSKVIEYAKKAVSDDRLDDAVIIVMMNEDAYAGTCVMYNLQSGDYGRGLSIAYFPTSSDTDTFNGLVTHEAGGHGFAKLGDEYAYENMGAVPESEITSVQEMAQYGWWKNVDFTSNPAQVKWSPFIGDERYTSENIGCYEGGLTYWTGVWRPTENSIMRYNTGGFNAPSRYAIWYRINKLAYGEDWNGTYDDFVTYDLEHRTEASPSQNSARTKSLVERRFEPLAPPVVVNKDWRELLSK